MEKGPREAENPNQVLIVEDSALMRGILEGHLLEIGYTVAAVENGRQALEKLATGYYPIVITDLVMPEMDGMELCRAVREQASGRYVYILMLTSQNSKEDMIRGLEAGADEYLVKPVNRAELMVRLKTANRILTLEGSLRKSYEEIKALSVKDPLTKVYNRGYLDERLVHEVKRAFRFERPLSLIMFDIDHFKLINDTFGHTVGDRVLVGCAALMQKSIRLEIDWIARYGGEEFVIVLPETLLSGAVVAAERLRNKLASMVMEANGAEMRVTASFGVASFMPANRKEDLSMASALITGADQGLYRAKKQGRNRVESVPL
ncbi:MAG: diguanylate cyclase [Deltaproteobacteria bacterium]|nr:diguanylate cyclase [Deltaproteobacteria bacterium]